MGRLLWLAFSGGEIFLREDLVDITRIFYERNKPSIILLPTNGLLPDTILGKTEEILRRCPKSTVAVKLSLDGPEELHDTLRGVPGAFRKTMDTYRRLATLLETYPNLEVGFNSVYCAANQDRMQELVGFVQNLDRSAAHTVSLIRGAVQDERLKEIDAEQYGRTAALMAMNLKKGATGIYRFKGARLKAAQDILQRRYIHKTLLKQKRLIPCHAGRLNLVLTEMGDVYPCEAFTNKMGNVRDEGYDMNNLLATEAARNAIRSVKSTGCYCTHECYFMTNILFTPSQYPALMKEYVLLSLHSRSRKSKCLPRELPTAKCTYR